MHPKFQTPEAAVSLIKSGDRIFIHGSAATPSFLIEKLAERKDELKNVEIVTISTFGDMPLAAPEMVESFFFNSLFVSQNIRSAANSSNGDYIPVFLSEIGQMFRKKSCHLMWLLYMYPLRMSTDTVP